MVKPLNFDRDVAFILATVVRGSMLSWESDGGTIAVGSWAPKEVDDVDSA